MKGSLPLTGGPIDKKRATSSFSWGSSLRRARIAFPFTRSHAALTVEPRAFSSLDRLKLAEFRQRSKFDSESVSENAKSLLEQYLAALGCSWLLLQLAADAVPVTDILYVNRFVKGPGGKQAREMNEKVKDVLTHAQRLETACYGG